MVPGMEIEATNKYGRIRITAGEGTERTYTWKDGRETVRLWKRRQRWYGALGIYSPGGGSRVHLVVEEGQQHFCSEDEAREWLLCHNDNVHPWAFASNGVVVAWYRSPGELAPGYRAVCVDVWQIVVNGQKAAVAGAPGAWSAWELFPGWKPESRLPGPGFSPSSPRRINGRLYSGKALDQMAEHDITPAAVEKAIATGECSPLEDTPGWRLFYKRGWHLLFVTMDTDGRVVDAHK